MSLQAPVTLRASVGQSAMMTGAQTRVNTLNPAVNHSALPFGMTRMGLNPSDERKGEERGSRGESQRKAEWTVESFLSTFFSVF